MVKLYMASNSGNVTTCYGLYNFFYTISLSRLEIAKVYADGGRAQAQQIHYLDFLDESRGKNQKISKK